MEVAQEPNEPDPNDVFRVLVATDNHLGYAEKDSAKGEDSFQTFEEILKLAVNNEVDFLLLGGDLFHENKPSRYARMKCLELLRKYCMGNRPIHIQFMSDPSMNFTSSWNPVVNYEDPNLNISLPVFSIHGNHDDPGGKNQYSAMDELSAAGLVNYFGKILDLTEIELTPILLRKGKSLLGIYGLSAVKDERLFRLFREGKVQFKRPRLKTDEWFNILVLHQNRAKHGPKNYLPETFLPGFLDLVIWGHEHECIPQPTFTANKTFILQPGSSVVTSLCEGEARPKHINLLQIHARRFKCDQIPLETVRPFIMEDFILSECDELQDVAENIEEMVEMKVEEKIHEMIEKSQELLTRNERQPKVPLIRLRVTYDNHFQPFHTIRFGQRYQGKVANPEDMIIFKKHIKNQPKEDLDFEAMDELFDMDPEELSNVRVENMVEVYFAENEDPKNKLHLLTERGMSEAVLRFVEKDDRDAITVLTKHQLKKTLDFLAKENKNEGEVEEDILCYRQARASSKQDVDEVRTTLDDKSRQPAHRDQSVESEGEGNDIQSDDEVEVEESPPARGRGRGRGRGRAKASYASPSKNSSRGRGMRSAQARQTGAAQLNVSTRPSTSSQRQMSLHDSFAASSRSRKQEAATKKPKGIHYLDDDDVACGNTRSLDQLKGLWNRLKVKATQDRDQQRKEAKKTGGGEKPPEMDELSNYINGVVLPPHAKSPLHNPFDSDSEGNLWKFEQRLAQTSRENLDPEQSLPKARKRKADFDDHLLEMVQKEHYIKMRIFQMKEWKLKHECEQMGIGLPPQLTERVTYFDLGVDGWVCECEGERRRAAFGLGALLRERMDSEAKDAGLELAWEEELEGLVNCYRAERNLQAWTVGPSRLTWLAHSTVHQRLRQTNVLQRFPRRTPIFDSGDGRVHPTVSRTTALARSPTPTGGSKDKWDGELVLTRLRQRGRLSSLKFIASYGAGLEEDLHKYIYKV
ncbi:unnamed protein product [Darwinula stevensoni]|uniref:Mre11 DNA-binding domain-containing protein n=1 Tax=Darwinula stevensoni TaxID=69355 RepID=A0A7R8X1X8_9CRUS|nr:unnamed protein product [Darwinula stevensoni]CAG0883308.1 unnamed protein product [Darwinula stevensoni]